jgi:hypothetical protein
VDLTNSAWRILADFYIRSGGFEKNHLATLGQGLEPFLSPAKINKRLEPSSPEPRIRSTTK